MVVIYHSIRCNDARTTMDWLLKGGINKPMRGYLNKASLGIGTALGAAGNTVAATSNITDSITELLPLIIELAIVVVLLSLVMRMMKQIKMN